MTSPLEPAAGKSDPSPAPPPSPAAKPEISIEEFQRLDLRIGRIVSAELHPKADRLLVLQVDTGDGAPRQLVAGIRGAYQPEQLAGRLVVVVANLKPAVLRGIESRGMVLAASGADAVVLLHPGRELPPGSIVK